MRGARGRKIIFTEEQSHAINTDCENILVSAGAGSGKTAVLTERILRLITEPDAEGECADVDKLLVVTFTEAAAAEMRERIESKIFERLAEKPDDARLLRQSAKLGSSRITTIHSFCRRLVRDHFQLAGLDPSFRVGDETELALLRRDAMGALFEEEYEKEENENFLDLADAFGGKTRDDGLDSLVRSLYEFLECAPYPETAATNYSAMFDHGNGLEGSLWAAIVKSELKSDLNGALERLAIARKLCAEPGGPNKYFDAIESDETLIINLLASLEKSFSEAHARFNSAAAPGAFARLYPYKANDGVDVTLKEAAKKIRDDCKDKIRGLCAEFFFAEPEKMTLDVGALRGRVNALTELTLKYGEKYSEEKRARNLLDFNDLERFALKILYPGGPSDLTPGPVAEGLRSMLRETLTDEYQDSNGKQELILSAVSKRRFMVGDVKQSIYRFRRAEPRLFIEKYNNYPLREGSGGGIRIDLSKNFRSRPEVINTVNFFFSQLMTPAVGEIDYDERAALQTSADYPPPPEGSSFETIIELAVAGRRDDGEDDPLVEELSNVEREAAVIANRIYILLNGQKIWDAREKKYRACKPGDIVILVRSLKNIAEELSEALKRRGVDAVADKREGFFEAHEIVTALAFLRIIDNPRQDIELLTALHSPVYGFTPDELLLIRDCSREADFYECMKIFTEQIENDENILFSSAQNKTKKFLSDLNRWRKAAAYLPVSRLVGLVYDETKYPAHCAAQEGGSAKRVNLRLLIERAVEYEETSFKGLFNFTRFVERLRNAERESRVSQAQPVFTSEDRVKIKTIHNAKGLEFPIVFVSALGRAFNKADERGGVVLHQEYGLGPEYIDLAERTRSDTLPRRVLSRLTSRENLSEELRILYVAMTRAKEKLILTGTVKHFESQKEKWRAAACGGGKTLPELYRRNCGCYLDWLMPCAFRHRDGEYVSGGFFSESSEAYNHPASFKIYVRGDEIFSQAPQSISQTKTESGNETRPAQNIPAGVYPFEPAKNLPSKISISELKRVYALETSPESGTLRENTFPVFERPAFFANDGAVSAARMGSVLHTIVEHIDLAVHVSEEKIEELIENLLGKNLFNVEEARAIDRRKILRFARSPVADRMRASDKIFREVPFVTALEPGEVYAEYEGKLQDERILAHGIIDCYFEENGSLVLVDFKNDEVRGRIENWAERHRVQIDLYKKALTRATGKTVSEALLYSFALGEAVSI